MIKAVSHYRRNPMPTPIKKKSAKAQQDNKRTSKPTAQELHHQTTKTAPAINPTNAADPSSSGVVTPNHPAGYSTPDSPGEGDQTTDSYRSDAIQNDGEKEIPQPETPLETPVKDNPKM